MVSLELSALALWPLSLFKVPLLFPRGGISGERLANSFRSGQSEGLMCYQKFREGVSGLRSQNIRAGLTLDCASLYIHLGQSRMQKFYRFHQGCLSFTLTPSGGERLPPHFTALYLVTPGCFLRPNSVLLRALLCLQSLYHHQQSPVLPLACLSLRHTSPPTPCHLLQIRRRVFVHARANTLSTESCPQMFLCIVDA